MLLLFSNCVQVKRACSWKCGTKVLLSEAMDIIYNICLWCSISILFSAMLGSQLGRLALFILYT